jgi:hypothetical protein
VNALSELSLFSVGAGQENQARRNSLSVQPALSESLLPTGENSLLPLLSWRVAPQPDPMMPASKNSKSDEEQETLLAAWLSHVSFVTIAVL